MIEQNVQPNQLPNVIKPAFKELKVLQHLKTAGFKRKFGYTCSFLFQLVFVFCFITKTGSVCLKVIRGNRFLAKTPSIVFSTTVAMLGADSCLYSVPQRLIRSVAQEVKTVFLDF
jgi:hypothetical protein